MNTKTKLNEAAKDLGVSNQELIDLIEKEMKVVKKPTAVMTTEEMTFVLEYYSQKNQVKDFNSYFDSRNQPKQEKKPEPKKADKKPAPKKDNVRRDSKPADNKPAQQPFLFHIILPSAS